MYLELPDGLTPRLLMRKRALQHDMAQHSEGAGNVAHVSACSCGRALAVLCDACRKPIVAVVVDDGAPCEHVDQLVSGTWAEASA